MFTVKHKQTGKFVDVYGVNKATGKSLLYELPDGTPEYQYNEKTEFLIYKDGWIWGNADDYTILTECDTCHSKALGCIGCVHEPESI